MTLEAAYTFEAKDTDGKILQLAGIDSDGILYALTKTSNLLFLDMANKRVKRYSGIVPFNYNGAQIEEAQGDSPQQVRCFLQQQNHQIWFRSEDEYQRRSWKMIDLANGNVTDEASLDMYYQIILSPSGRLALSPIPEPTLYDLTGQKRKKLQPAKSINEEYVCFSGDERGIATRDTITKPNGKPSGYTVTFYTTSTGQAFGIPFSMKGLPGIVNPHGNSGYSVTFNDMIYILNNTGQVFSQVPQQCSNSEKDEDIINWAIPSADGQYLLLWRNAPQSLRLINLETGWYADDNLDNQLPYPDLVKVSPDLRMLYYANQQHIIGVDLSPLFNDLHRIEDGPSDNKWTSWK